MKKKEKKRFAILQSRFLQDITGKNINICNCVMRQKKFIFSLKYCQRNVDLNAGKK